MLLIVYLLFAVILQAAPGDSTDYQQANAQYEAKNYSQAIDIYENVLAAKGASAEMYYNLGNAYYKNGQLGRSILNYERCLKLEPGSDDAAFNLEMANLRIKDKLQPVNELIVIKWWKEFINFFTAARWSFITILLIWIAFAAFAVYRLKRSYNARRLAFTLFVCFFVLFVFSFAIAMSKRSYDAHNHFAVIISPSATVKSGPNESETNLFLIHEGLKLQILESDNNWTKIKMFDGNEGWILNNAFEKI